MRAAADEHIRLRRGLASLATIAAIAPFFGFLGFWVSMTSAFGGMSAEGTPLVAIIIGSLVEGMMPPMIGFTVAAFALGLHKYLLNRLAIMDIEMKAVSLNLTNDLARLPYHF
jgi:biopolymer transport protein TolQ